MSMRKIGVLTSGGDSPGMNAAVMSVARSAALYGIPLIGVKRGYNGLLRKSSNLKDDLQELTMELVLDIADEPGTYLRTARCLEFKEKKVQEKAIKTLKNMQIDGLVVIGGDGYSPHKLRATAATTAIRRGSDISRVASLLDHDSIQTTKRYIKVTEEDKREVMATMEAIDTD